MTVRRVALLTAGGFAPCLSSAVGGLIQRYTEIAPDIEIIAYQYGYHGLLTGNYVVVGEEARRSAHILSRFGGSPIGNSRVKLTNAKNLVERGLVKEGEDPLAAADLAAYLKEHDYDLTVVGLPKTIDNDIVPIRQSLGAWTAAEEASGFAQHVIGEHRSNPRMLIVHEVMGRNCGYLTAQSAQYYHAWVVEQEWAPALGLSKERWDVHAVYLPELSIDIDGEAKRLRGIMDEIGNVNIFLSEGAGVDEIVAEKEAAGEEVERDPFGHVKLDTVNPGQWFAKQFAERIGAEKVMVQKSGYYSRAWHSNADDLALIGSMVDMAVDCALEGTSGVIGQDEENGDELSCIAFPRIKGHKAFDVSQRWFANLMGAIGQKFEVR